MPPEITALAPPWAVGILVVALIILHLGRMLAEASETWAKVLGPLGKRWRDRGLHRRQERLDERDARRADLEDAVRQRDTLAHALDACRDNQDDLWGYMVYDADYHRRLALSAAATGCTLPTHLSFTQWKDQQ